MRNEKQIKLFFHKYKREIWLIIEVVLITIFMILLSYGIYKIFTVIITWGLRLYASYEDDKEEGEGEEEEEGERGEGGSRRD